MRERARDARGAPSQIQNRYTAFDNSSPTSIARRFRKPGVSEGERKTKCEWWSEEGGREEEGVLKSRGPRQIEKRRVKGEGRRRKEKERDGGWVSRGIIARARVCCTRGKKGERNGTGE